MRRLIITALATATLVTHPAAAGQTKIHAPPWTGAEASGICDEGIFPHFIPVGECVHSATADPATGRVLHRIDTSGNRSATQDSRVWFDRAYARSGRSLTYEVRFEIAELTAPPRSEVDLIVSASFPGCGCSATAFEVLSFGETSIRDRVMTPRVTLTPEGGRLPDGTVTISTVVLAHAGSGGLSDSLVLDATVASIVETVSH